ncbi:MAG TPA: hypothetical protein VMU50_04845, partial [Polyangia bacterium]|nr:hypothetical protein [Polyangia bacterium]
VLETVAAAEKSEGTGSSDLRYLRAQACEVLALRQPPGGPERRRFLDAALADLQVATTPGTVTLIGSLVAGATSFAGLTRLGTVLLLLGRPIEAASAFESALVARPEHEEAQLGRVEAALQSGDVGRAWALVKPLLGAGRDAWLLAAAIAHASGQSASARTLLDRARAPGLPHYLALHRREREAALGAAIPS